MYFLARKSKIAFEWLLFSSSGMIGKATSSCRPVQPQPQTTFWGAIWTLREKNLKQNPQAARQNCLGSHVVGQCFSDIVTIGLLSDCEIWALMLQALHFLWSSTPKSCQKLKQLDSWSTGTKENPKVVFAKMTTSCRFHTSFLPKVSKCHTTLSISKKEKKTFPQLPHRWKKTNKKNYSCPHSAP